MRTRVRLDRAGWVKTGKGDLRIQRKVRRAGFSNFKGLVPPSPFIYIAVQSQRSTLTSVSQIHLSHSEHKRIYNHAFGALRSCSP